MPTLLFRAISESAWVGGVEILRLIILVLWVGIGRTIFLEAIKKLERAEEAEGDSLPLTLQEWSNIVVYRVGGSGLGLLWFALVDPLYAIFWLLIALSGYLMTNNHGKRRNITKKVIARLKSIKPQVRVGNPFPTPTPN